MKYLKVLWWLCVAYIPVAVFQIADGLYAEVGCPPRQECYAPGTIAATELEFLAFGLVLLLWPVCLWFLGGGYILKKVFRRQAPNHSLQARRP
jgi:hypothetical protein